MRGRTADRPSCHDRLLNFSLFTLLSVKKVYPWKSSDAPSGPSAAKACPLPCQNQLHPQQSEVLQLADALHRRKAVRQFHGSPYDHTVHTGHGRP